jgi:hypothetical protein
MKTAIIMSSMPKIPLIVEVSWKTGSKRKITLGIRNKIADLYL